MKITLELEDQSDNDAAALCAWLDSLLRDEGYKPSRISWSSGITAPHLHNDCHGFGGGVSSGIEKP